MRKRQWKKILSVVLALAMVFSMNVSAFAEPAAEFPETEPAAGDTYTSEIGAYSPSKDLESTEKLSEAIQLTVEDGEGNPVEDNLTLTGSYVVTKDGEAQAAVNDVDLAATTIASIVTAKSLTADDTIAVTVTDVEVNSVDATLPSPAVATITLTAAPTYTSEIGAYSPSKDLESTEKLSEAIQLTVEDGEGNPVEDNLTLTGSYVVTKDGEAQAAVNDVDLAATTIASIV
ncbi:MAG: hypothetical protein K6F86_10260, partial [Lachnospiraceae bacterium]|nr:hypothetical protein [Lachnospiraceae bacterium]